MIRERNNICFLLFTFRIYRKYFGLQRYEIRDVVIKKFVRELENCAVVHNGVARIILWIVQMITFLKFLPFGIRICRISFIQ